MAVFIDRRPILLSVRQTSGAADTAAHASHAFDKVGVEGILALFGKSQAAFFYSVANAGLEFKRGLPDLADSFQVILVCADGGKTSWWFDSPKDPSFRYETHVFRELVPWVDAHYRTIPERGKRAIMGASMGGHGACWIGFRHKDIFGAVGTIVGGLDLWDFPDSWDIAKRLGPRDEFPDRWRKHSAVAEAAKLKTGELELVFIAGTSDFFLPSNRRMHSILLDNKIAHIYIEIRGRDDKSSGHHDFSFTRNSECWAVLASFFRSYFNTGTGRLVCETKIESASPCAP